MNLMKMDDLIEQISEIDADIVDAVAKKYQRRGRIELIDIITQAYKEAIENIQAAKLDYIEDIESLNHRLHELERKKDYINSFLI